jgi:hypothetical protein
MTRRYSNFHRARKYYRKSLRAKLAGYRTTAAYYREKYEKYDALAYCHDGINTFHVDVDTPKQRLIIRAHFDPLEATSHLPIELRYRAIGISHVSTIPEGTVYRGEIVANKMSYQTPPQWSNDHGRS